AGRGPGWSGTGLGGERAGRGPAWAGSGLGGERAGRGPGWSGTGLGGDRAGRGPGWAGTGLGGDRAGRGPGWSGQAPADVSLDVMAEFIYTMRKARKAHGDKVLLDDVTLSFLPGAK